ncbi:MAG: hypothetical protein IPN95_19225 [Bacteroidetes bacterium]|nr:hypothetical protein [Bacteroidota bacterium]
MESTQRFKAFQNSKSHYAFHVGRQKRYKLLRTASEAGASICVLGHIAKAFNQTAFEAADTLKNYTSRYGGYANFSNQYKYEIYVPQRNK